LSAPVLLALETSCDETAAAVMEGTSKLRSSIIASQAAVHAAYGGVVPEVASRNHLVHVREVVARSLSEAGLSIHEVDVFAGTTGPGLASALLVGAAAAKGLALASEKPFLAVNHVEGHLLSPFFGRDTVPPCVALVVSGGHTLLVDVEGVGRYRLLGRTRDDAAGEAFDKVAKLLGLGYPGGPEIERRAREGNAARFALPRSMQCSGDHQFSFSGLKTAVRYLLPQTSPADVSDLCAGFQAAVVDVLVSKAVRAAQASRRDLIAVSGGVAGNRQLREQLNAEAAGKGIGVVFAEPWLCADNAAMIAYAAAQRWQAGQRSSLAEDISPTLGDNLFAAA
jgi:N6-L-threonylcarbamoyladenine synthase